MNEDHGCKSTLEMSVNKFYGKKIEIGIEIRIKMKIKIIIIIT